MGFKITVIFQVWIMGTLISHAQVLIPDFRVNNIQQNTKGLGRPDITATANGAFAVAWQDYNDYNRPVAEQPRVAVQMFSASLQPIGPLNLFQGESRSLSIWTSDFLEENADIEFLPDGTLLVAVEHEGWISIGSDELRSSEVGIGMVSAQGQMIDVNNTEGVILWLSASEARNMEIPRLATAPNGEFILVTSGQTYNTRRLAVFVQPFDENGNFIGNFFMSHPDDPGPQADHSSPDVATNGNLHLVVWQSNRQDTNWDIFAQFYTDAGPLGNRVPVNSGDPSGTINIAPSVAMNASGASVVVWVDTRTGNASDIFGQRFDSDGKPVGGNFQISTGLGAIWDRPEVAMLADGSFMVVWTDSLRGVSGLSAFRARGRVFGPDGMPLGAPFVIPNYDGPSGLVNIGTDGNTYYCTWLDARDGSQYLNLYAKRFGPHAVTSIEDRASTSVPAEFALYNAYPNPFNPSTTIAFDIPRQTRVQLTVYDLLGREVKRLVEVALAPGRYEVVWDGQDAAGRAVASGVYVYRLMAEKFEQTRKMVLMR